MSLESDLKTSLQANATLTAVVGTRTEPAPLRASQTLPAVTWFRMGTPTVEQNIDGTIVGTLASFQFDAWAPNPQGAQEAMAALITALLAFTTNRHGIIFNGPWDVPEPDDIPVFHRALRVDILT